MQWYSSVQTKQRTERFICEHRLGLATLVFTDMVNSTELKRKIGDHAATSLIQQHHSIVRAILA
jgi:class 3 adenylate cyclase